MPTAYTRMIEDVPEEKRPFTCEEMPPEKLGPIVTYLTNDEAKDITGKTIRAADDCVGVVSDRRSRGTGSRTAAGAPRAFAVSGSVVMTSRIGTLDSSSANRVLRCRATATVRVPPRI